MVGGRLVFFLLVLSACAPEIKTDGEFYQTVLEIEENVNIYPSRLRQLERIDSSRICVFIENDFDQDEVGLYINSSVVPVIKIVTTDESLGVASFYELGNISEIEELHIQVNGGPLVALPVEGKHPLWAIRLWSDTLKAVRLAAYSVSFCATHIGFIVPGISAKLCHLRT